MESNFIGWLDSYPVFSPLVNAIFNQVQVKFPCVCDFLYIVDTFLHLLPFRFPELNYLLASGTSSSSFSWLFSSILLLFMNFILDCLGIKLNS